jgi:hypothetical protein
MTTAALVESCKNADKKKASAQLDPDQGKVDGQIKPTARVTPTQ